MQSWVHARDSKDCLLGGGWHRKKTNNWGLFGKIWVYVNFRQLFRKDKLNVKKLWWVVYIRKTISGIAAYFFPFSVYITLYRCFFPDNILKSFTYTSCNWANIDRCGPIPKKKSTLQVCACIAERLVCLEKLCFKGKSHFSYVWYLALISWDSIAFQQYKAKLREIVYRQMFGWWWPEKVQQWCYINHKFNNGLDYKLNLRNWHCLNSAHCCVLSIRIPSAPLLGYHHKFGDDDGIMAGLLGRVDYYDSSREEWTQYVERLEHFFTANGVDTDAKKLSAFLAVIARFSCIQSAAQLGSTGEVWGQILRWGSGKL